MPIDVPREPTSEETPKAITKQSAASSASHPAELREMGFHIIERARQQGRRHEGEQEGQADSREHEAEARGHSCGEERQP